MSDTRAQPSVLRARPPASPPRQPRGYWRLHWRGLSVLIERRGMLALLALALLGAAVAALSLGQGSVRIPPGRVIAALLGAADAPTTLVVRQLRLGRVFAGAAAGAALGMAGCLLQTVARNRLATPTTLGIDNAATAFAVASVVGVSTSLAPAAFALTGALSMLALVFALSGPGDTRGYRFLLTGMGLGAICGAATNIMLARAPIDAANQAYPWTVGTLNNRAGPTLALLGWSLLVLTPLALVLGAALNVARLPEPVARSLGVRITQLRVGAIALAGLLTGLAVAVIGPVGIIGLAAPELARRLAGPRSVPVLAAGLAGASLTMLADLAGRTLCAPSELPVGIVAALVGGPYVLWVLLRTPQGALNA